MATIYANGDTLGTASRDEIYGSSGADQIEGRGGNDWIQGNRGHDVIFGDTGNDTIWGGSGNDLILGGAGRNMLTGHGGNDVFVFNQALSSSNVDTITDFSVRHDTIILTPNVFKGVGVSDRDMRSSAFWTGESAHDANDRIIYNKGTGSVYYDPDGSGSRAAVEFAKIDANLKLTYKDLYVLNP
ncbi:calcium-binding protein [Microvirga terrestris]|uniref:Calcium-binding protein n=1 Tax=Microvirga terrestris TaxID=2791024 RepID=A0ABS0HQT8_9HYPH|nr:calcium-binding protein [Microvirga terrestris]MBF9195587.1 calcium-binding protein [Microvirga terrestris]